MKKLKRYRLSALAVTGVVAIGAWMLVGCSKQLAGNETGASVEVALPALVIEPSQALFFGSAAGNPDSAPTQETSPNSDLFSVQVVDPATTAATETTPSKASTSLSNVWVLQFDGGGTTRACVYVGTVNAGSNILATLESGEGYSVWVVANGPGNGSFTTSNPATLSDFESKLLYTGNTTADSQIPLCGKIENVTVLKNGQLLAGNNSAIAPSILLRRAQARVDMILEYDVSGAVFDGAWLYNVPTGACYGLLESAADGFPEAESGNFSYTEGFLEGATHVQGTQNANSTYTWYMGDNRRGTKSSILFEVQKHQANAPQYATYIRIKGHEQSDETKYLFHDVYLGKTKTSDFNVLRNWSYTFRVRIGGTLAQQKALAVDDPRVSTGVLDLMKSITVTPDPATIPQTGGEYTITMQGLWAGDISVRVWDGETALDEGTITYSSESKGGSTTLTVPANDLYTQKSIAFQYYWNNTWTTIQTGVQDNCKITNATVSPDPTNFSYAATQFTVTLTGSWSGSVPVRAIVEGSSSALVSGEVTTSGKGVSLTVPANSYPNPARTIIFQYQWDGAWEDIDRGTQAAESPSISQATVSPDPSGGFSSDATEFTVTLTGKWEGSIAVLAIVDGGSVVANGSVTTSGTGVQLTVPKNTSSSSRTILFQYQWEGQWVEIDRGKQEAAPIDGGGGIEISPDPGQKTAWENAITYCKNKGTGWRLPTASELMYMWCIAPSVTGEAAFATEWYWTATTQGSTIAANTMNFSFGELSSHKLYENSVYVRCVRDKVSTGQTYPYITTASDGGVVIVLRDENGGVDEANLFPNRLTASATGNEQSTDNRMSRKFRVLKTSYGRKTWDESRNFCDALTEEGYSDWRLPTQRELQMIALLGGSSDVTSLYTNNTGVGNDAAPLYTPYLYQQSGLIRFGDINWSTTPSSILPSEQPYAWCMNFDSPFYGIMYYNTTTTTHFFRCVRDEW